MGRTCVLCAVALAVIPAFGLANCFVDLPEEAKPEIVSKRIAEHFLECPADEYRPRGYTYRITYGGKCVMYPLVSLWVNALANARLAGDADLEKRLIEHFEPFLGEKKAKQSPMNHVDYSVFGALPLEISILNGDERCRKLGLLYADTQWTPPSEDTVKAQHSLPIERQQELWEKGYTPQTRLWIDDMYMITLLQLQAYKATGDRKYLDRTMREMCLYLKELQLKDGPAEGLFYHAPDVPFVWGRGAGWMAAGMALLLTEASNDSPERQAIMDGYRKMMAALLKHQRPNGLWGQLVNDPESWDETSGSAMYAYAFVVGVRRGWLDAEKYGPAARRAWLALVDKLDEYANLRDVCVGTAKKDDRTWYMERPRVVGDPHGQAAMMWICGALMEKTSTIPAAVMADSSGDIFADGTRICFLGDSITAQSQWCRVVADYLFTRFPERRFTLTNAGIPGDKAKESLLRLDEDVFPRNPDIVTVMFGINDALRNGGYVASPTPEQIESRNAAFDVFAESLPLLSESLARGAPRAKVWWFTPPPYDEEAKAEAPQRPGLGASVAKCAGIVRRHAAATGDRLCELYVPMAEYNANVREGDSASASLCGTDRIHPGVEGGFFMACHILKSWNAPSLVSEVSIDFSRGLCTTSDNARTIMLSTAQDRVAFDVEEKSLPMLVQKEARRIAERLRFAETLNREILRVENLPQGMWTLSIDGVAVTNLPAAAWEAGVNLSALQTPQLKQSGKVSALNAKRIGLERRLRRLAMERHFLRVRVANLDIDDWDAVKCAAKSFEGRKGYFEELLPWFVEQWPTRHKIVDEIAKIEEEISAYNKPVPHRYELAVLPSPTRAVSRIEKLQKRAVSEAERRALIAPVANGELRLRPMFATCGVVFGAPADAKPDFRYRADGGDWCKADRVVYFPDVENWRGILPDLAEDAGYEVSFSAGGVTRTERFRTWKSDVPIARTVEIDPATASFPMFVSDKGSSDGWIRYTAKGGTHIVSEADCDLITVTNAAYVLFDDMKIVGGRGTRVFRLVDSEHVRIRNCDISGWGFEATPHYDDLGKLSAGYNAEKGRYEKYNQTAAISIERGMRCTTVERCWIHDPISRSVSWRYCHPLGPVAVALRHPDHSTSIRFCDFTGSDFHRWDDAVTSFGNFDETGGFNRDAEVYGNFMAFANDDCIELDGGQQNIDCSRNRFEGALVGVSIQGNVVSPSFVRNNLFSGMGEEFGGCGETIKTSGFDIYGFAPYSAVVGNVLWGKGSGLNIGNIVGSRKEFGESAVGRIDVENNSVCGTQQLRGADVMTNCVVIGNALSVELSESDLDRALPLRPLPFILDKCRIDAGFLPAPVKVRATCENDAKVLFSIAKPDNMDWFKVEPSSGELIDGTEFTVSFVHDKMKGRRFWRGCFLVRTPDGYSRPVSVYAESDYKLPYHAERKGKAFYSEDLKEGEFAVPSGDGVEASIDLPVAGRFYFMLHGKANWSVAMANVSIDGDPPVPTALQFEKDRGVWCCLDPGAKPTLSRVRPFDLEAGRHTVKVWPVKARLWIDGAALVEDPGEFEPR